MPDLPPVPMAALASCYSAKRVLVTGHTGFKGSWLSLWLDRLGAEVIGVALDPPPGPSMFASLDLARVIDHRIGDIRSAEDFARATEGVDADLVIHMAAQSLVRPSYENPVDTFATNVTGTAVVLDRVRHMPSLKGVVVVTSDKCYENHEWEWPYRETDQLGGSDPYSASKGCTELVASSFRRSFYSTPGSPHIATVRAGNVIGGGDWAVDRLIPDIIRATLSGTAVTIRNPASVRPWQHVLEPLSGYLEIGARLLSDDGAKFAEAWNFGPSPSAFQEVEPIARRLQSAWGPGAAQIAFGKRPDEPHEARLLTLDSSKAQQRLGWQPRLTTDEAIAMTAEWYRTYAAGRDDLREFTLDQIDRFCGIEPSMNQQEGKRPVCA
ncbi:CDP-glucose 4,6-dehydratase [Qipengyuania sp. 6B39]|uniref:CDP-glucose 4,6-dehydratase n=1 Tax=Qipengyuania proteolytica TaxID=2867239 RepID=UPI001C8A8C55|nr:CDP-glucose 4,6-dehydratase [Qipengyuania proteolytica]MBX7495802.1 CDP-glucose 4,6-dehydratase [Qipengyuania proteolytica]